MTVSADRRARKNVAILIAAQAFLGSQMPMLFVIGGLAGQMLSPIACLATLPISLIVFGSMLTAPWLSNAMQRFGRRTGFAIGAAGGAAGAVIGAAGLINGSFLLFLIGAFLSGIYMSSQGFFRFAATDTASDAFKPKAISYVMAGGLISAVIGPQLVKVTTGLFAVEYLGTYLTIIAINAVGVCLFYFLDIPTPAPAREQRGEGRSRGEMLLSPPILTAVICGMVAYALMNLVMTSTPLAVVGNGYGQSRAADIVSAHVIAMFAPSFFTGHLIARFGVHRIIAIGLALLALAGTVALLGLTLFNFFGALILLGLGWNFGFIGATSLLAASHSSAEKGRIQGINDAIVFGCVTLASLASGGLLNCSGGDVVQGWNLVNIAMIPFLLLAGGTLLWLVLRGRRAIAGR